MWHAGNDSKQRSAALVCHCKFTAWRRNKRTPWALLGFVLVHGLCPSKSTSFICQRVLLGSFTHPPLGNQMRWFHLLCTSRLCHHHSADVSAVLLANTANIWILVILMGEYLVAGRGTTNDNNINLFVVLWTLYLDLNWVLWFWFQQMGS